MNTYILCVCDRVLELCNGMRLCVLLCYLQLLVVSYVSLFSVSSFVTSSLRGWCCGSYLLLIYIACLFLYSDLCR